MPIRNLRDPIKSAQWATMSPEDRKRSKRTNKKYGINTKEIEFIAKSTDNKCHICEAKTTLVVDHDHAIKEPSYRGLLCNSCNLMLGHAKDDITILEKAINYLKKSNSTTQPEAETAVAPEASNRSE